MIKGINLIPADIRRQWRLKKVRRLFAIIAVVYLVVLGAVYADKKMELSGRLGELAVLNGKKAELANKSAEYRSMQARLAELKRTEETLARRLALSSGLATDRVSWSGVLRRLSNDVPDGVWLRSLATSDLERPSGATGAAQAVAAVKDGAGAKKVRFLGSAVANAAVAAFIRNLEDSGYLSDVNLEYTQKRDFDTMTVFDFEITARLARSGEVADGR